MALTITIILVILTIAGSVLYGSRNRGSGGVTEWAVGGRRMGTLIFWFLNAGEIYTTFAVLGISGYAWAYGAPAYLAFLSVSLTAAVGYWLTPRIWHAGKAGNFITQADFFADHYRARWLGIVVGLAGIAALIVYVQIQITALALVLRLSVDAEISNTASAIAAAVLMLLFVMSAGLRSAAFAAAVKDILMVVIVIALSATVAGHVGASSIGDVFTRVQDAYPGIGSLPGRDPDMGLSTIWMMTAGINVALGTYIFPHMFQLTYSASDSWAVRRNAVFQPLYSLSYFFIILLGFGALLAGTMPALDDPNAVLLTFVADRYPAWAIGLFAGTACLLALVPGSVLLLTAGSIFSRNVVRPMMPGLSDTSELLISRISMVGCAAIAVYLTIGATQSLVDIGLTAYASIGMLAPGVFLAFLWRQTNAFAVLAGIGTGYVVLMLPSSSPLMAWFPEWEAGLVAMLFNALVVLALSPLLNLVTGKREQAAAG
ncbi:sodium:solute symporter family protein [Altericroceibacterium endophyticum]|uniref:Sodium:solute symporter family protein n=1 Tax=Altericroceibacterium endophyticum TaxID=1808508 RepID=A0A6I4T8C0_9SPHN|nr:sodium:solute symporter family protein [Altericroceibacterium endophyticum]MXO67176.1 sodium:solute symporter family protein [Altericroceibacterium endophyticum]